MTPEEFCASRTAALKPFEASGTVMDHAKWERRAVDLLREVEQMAEALKN
jgi:hypothetical protein